MDLFPEPSKDQVNPFMRFPWIKKAVNLLNSLINAKGTNGVTVTVNENGITIDGGGIAAPAISTGPPFKFVASVYDPETDGITSDLIAYDGKGGLTDGGPYDGG